METPPKAERQINKKKKKKKKKKSGFKRTHRAKVHSPTIIKVIDFKFMNEMIQSKNRNKISQVIRITADPPVPILPCPIPFQK